MEQPQREQPERWRHGKEGNLHSTLPAALGRESGGGRCAENQEKKKLGFKRTSREKRKATSLPSGGGAIGKLLQLRGTGEEHHLRCQPTLQAQAGAGRGHNEQPVGLPCPQGRKPTPRLVVPRTDEEGGVLKGSGAVGKLPRPLL